MFNEKNPAASHRFALPRSFATVEVLSGSGEVSIDGKGIIATIINPFGYLLVKLAGL